MVKAKPAVVQNYNDHVSDVDRSDQLLSYYAFSRRNIKLFKKLFFHLLNLTVINSYVIHNKILKEKGIIKWFSLAFTELAMQLVNDGTGPIRQIQRQAPSSRAFHFSI